MSSGFYKNRSILPATLVMLTLSGCAGNLSSSSGGTSSLQSLSGSNTINGQASGSTASLSLSVSKSTVTPGGTIELFPYGGSGGYVYAIYQGGGSIKGTLYTAPANNSSVELEVVDSAGTKAYVAVTVSSAVPSPTPTASGPLTIKSQQVYTNQSITMSSSGGDGVYQYSLQGGGGTLTGASYLAPSYPTTATIQVADNSGHTSTATVEVTSSAFLSNGAVLYAENSLFITFNMPTNLGALYPSFAIGGAGNNHVFGYNYNEMTETTYFAPGAASASIAITNYDLNNTSPYTGTLNMLGQTGISASVNFCFMPGTTMAHLQAVNGVTTSVSNTSVSYGAYASGVSGGNSLQGIWFNNINTATPLETAQVWVSQGRHNLSLTDCSSYTGSYMNSSSLY